MQFGSLEVRIGIAFELVRVFDDLLFIFEQRLSQNDLGAKTLWAKIDPTTHI